MIRARALQMINLQKNRSYDRLNIQSVLVAPMFPLGHIGTLQPCPTTVLMLGWLEFSFLHSAFRSLLQLSRCQTWHKSLVSLSLPPLQVLDHWKVERVDKHRDIMTNLWNPIRIPSFAFGLWGIWNTTEPARRSRAMLAISEAWWSPKDNLIA